MREMGEKKRILFVDDEPMVTQGMRRMMRSMRELFDAHYVNSGKEALEVMEQEPFDCIVSDMRMPNMNGAELLNCVQQRYPQTMRIILSGYSDRDLIMQCVQGTHQFLSKPCDAEKLRSVLTQGLGITADGANWGVRQLIGKLNKLPSFPSLYLKVKSLVDDPESTAEEVGRVISQDPGMTAKILQIINSAYFGIGTECSNPTEAVMQLGFETIKALILGLKIFESMDVTHCAGINSQRLWQHAQRVGVMAGQLGRAKKAEPSVYDECVTAGMLHDIGYLILAANCSKEYGEVAALAKADALDLVEAERRVFGATHADIGAHLFTLWGLPKNIIEAVRRHHDHQVAEYEEFNTSIAVYIANLADLEIHGPVATISDTSGRCAVPPASKAAMELLARCREWASEMHERNENP